MGNITCSNGFENLKILFYIPRRGKGHTEVLSNVNISVTGEGKEPEDMFYPFIEYQRKSLDKEIVKEIGEKLVDLVDPYDMNMNISFSIPVNKLSPDLNNSLHYSLDCNYSVTYNGNTELYTSMSVSCPVRVRYVSVLQGRVYLKVNNPVKYLYFEDLLDAIQKHGGVNIYSILDFKDIEKLDREIDRGKDLSEYLDKLKKYVIKSKIGEGGEIKVEVNNVYNNYLIKKGVEW